MPQALGKVESALATLGQVQDPRNAARPPLLLDRLHEQILRARAQLLLAQTAGAVQTARQALETLERSPLRRDFQTLEAEGALALGEALRRSGDLPAARAALERALALRTATDDPSSLWLAEAEGALAGCLADQGDGGRARTLLRSAQAITASHEQVGAHLTRPLRLLASRLAVNSSPADGLARRKGPSGPLRPID